VSARGTGGAETVRIDRLDTEGDGLAVSGSRLLRVAQVIPGETVDVVAAVGRRPAAPGLAVPCELVRVVTPSPHRVAARCRHFGPCGGCAWQHIAYPHQLTLKQALVQRLLDEELGPKAPRVLATLPTPPASVGASSASPLPPSASRLPPDGSGQPPSASSLAVSDPWHYRNKVSFVLGTAGRAEPLVLGHYRRASRTVLPVVECPVHAEAGNRVAFALRDILVRARIPGTPGNSLDGVARHVVIRTAEAATDWLATLVVTENVKPLRRVTEAFTAWAAGTAGRWGFSLNVHDRPGPFLFGRETRHLGGVREIREPVGGVKYVLSPTSFFQTNVRAARVLVSLVLDALADARFGRILDLYAGVGLFALPLVRATRSVTAVEENREAMAAAAAAARENRLPERALRVMPARVEDALTRLSPRTEAEAWDAVVLDPPREGCPGAVLDWLFRTARPARIVYVSCNPEALARDLPRAPLAGYVIESVRPLDMFPHTPHVETVAILDRTAGS
jgi:23S rRNA (uracil1939-C5)-methyltransferase